MKKLVKKRPRTRCNRCKRCKKRSEIYYKDLAEDYSKNKVFKTNNIAFGLGSNEMAISVNIFKKDYCVSPAYKVFELKKQNALYFKAQL
jgi:hypothetical protein